MGTLTSLAAKKVRINLLYDFYGQLLTERQRALLALYYQADLSLGEIAETQAVSRQAVYDILKRSERTLEDLESKLQLVEKHRKDRLVLQEITKELELARARLLCIAASDGRADAPDSDAAIVDLMTEVAARLLGAAERLKTLD